MKLSSMFFVVLTTFILFTVTIMSAMDFPFNWVFYLTVGGQVLVVIMVYKMLTDSYTTTKTFKDFYEDYDVKSLETERY